MSERPPLVFDGKSKAATKSTAKPAIPSQPPAKAASPPEKSFTTVLAGALSEVQQGERLMKRVTAGVGKDVSAGDLLALQAGVYRYVEVVDLTSKLVDRVAQGAKQLVQGGGQ